MSIIIASILGSLFFGWLVDTRIYKPKRHWVDLQHWAREFKQAIYSESSYEALTNKEKIMCKRFQKADKYICQSMTNPMFHDLFQTLENQKDSSLSKYKNHEN